MSENEKDNKDFEFIKEQVIEKKRRKLRKRLIPLAMTVCLAIIFGLIAAVTFVITEPRLYKMLHKEDESKTSVSFPTKYPAESEGQLTGTPSPTPGPDEETDDSAEEPSKTVYVEQSIAANLEDYLSMYDEIRSLAYESNKSLLNVTSIINVIDWFGKSVDQTINTTGVIIANNNKDLLILVSLDRVKDANSIKIEFSDTVAIDAVLQDYESEINLAVIAVAIEDIPPIFMNSIQVANLGESYTVTVGSPIIALGSPNGHPGSMEMGIITSRGSWASVTDNKLDLFNTNIENNENSDGIIVNLNGEIVGLITRTLKEDVNKDLNTVIGISKIKPIIERIANQIPRIYFGVITEDMTEATKLMNNISNGIYVNEVQANSPAFTAGMKNGDIILQVNDKSIINTANFYNTISGYQPGETIIVKIKRSAGTTEKEMTLSIILAEKEK